MVRSVPQRGSLPFPLAAIFAIVLLLALFGATAVLSVLMLRGSFSLPAAEGLATPDPALAVALAPTPAPRDVVPAEIAAPTPEPLPPTPEPTPLPPEPTPTPEPLLITPTPVAIDGPDPFPVGAPSAPGARVSCNRRITHVVKPGENLFRIALRYNTTAQSIANLNGIADVRQIRAGQRLVIVTCAGRTVSGGRGTYVVQPGDTLFRIALNHGTTVSALRVANGLRSNVIYPGQVLRIP